MRRGQTVLAGAAVLLALGVWAYGAWVFAPTFNAERVAGGYLFGPYPSDLYSSWLPARELLFHGTDPYSPAITAAVQQGFYGRPLTPADSITATEAFVYPPWIVFLFAPVAGWPFSAVMAGFALVAPLLCAGVAVGGLAALGWRPTRLTTAVLLLLSTATIPAIYIYYLQQPTLLVAAFMAAACFLLWRAESQAQSPRPRLLLQAGAGGLLALATVKPQLVWAPILWLLVWAVSDWRRRQGLVWGLVGGGAALALGATLLVPDWPGAWLAALRDYQIYATDLPPLGLLLPAAWLVPVEAVLGLGVAFLLWRLRRAAPGTAAWGQALGLATLFGVLVIPSWVPYNGVLLYGGALAVIMPWAAAPRRALLAGALTGWLFLPMVMAAGLAAAWGMARLAGGDGAAVAYWWRLAYVPGLLTPILLLGPLGWLAWKSSGEATR